MELAAGPGVDGRPAVLAVVLEAGDVGAEERRKLAAAARALALVTQLVVQDVWLHFHLGRGREEGLHSSERIRNNGLNEGKKQEDTAKMDI